MNLLQRRYYCTVTVTPPRVGMDIQRYSFRLSFYNELAAVDESFQVRHALPKRLPTFPVQCRVCSSSTTCAAMGGTRLKYAMTIIAAAFGYATLPPAISDQRRKAQEEVPFPRPLPTAKTRRHCGRRKGHNVRNGRVLVIVSVPCNDTPPSTDMAASTVLRGTRTTLQEKPSGAEASVASASSLLPASARVSSVTCGMSVSARIACVNCPHTKIMLGKQVRSRSVGAARRAGENGATSPGAAL